MCKVIMLRWTGAAKTGKSIMLECRSFMSTWENSWGRKENHEEDVWVHFGTHGCTSGRFGEILHFRDVITETQQRHEVSRDHVVTFSLCGTIEVRCSATRQM